MANKKCSKCGEFKELPMFYKQKDGAFGLRADCKSCFKKSNQESIEKHRNFYRKRKNMWRFKNRNRQEKQEVTNVVSNAVQSGKLIKPKTCLCCDCERPLQAHHHDYDKPLDIIWLCSKCHGFIHSYFFIALQGDKR